MADIVWSMATDNQQMCCSSFLQRQVGLSPGLGKVKVTIFRVTASSLSTPHTAHCCLLPPMNSAPFRLYPGGPLPPLLCRGTHQPSPVADIHTDTDKHLFWSIFGFSIQHFQQSINSNCFYYSLDIGYFAVHFAVNQWSQKFLSVCDLKSTNRNSLLFSLLPKNM